MYSYYSSLPKFFFGSFLSFPSLNISFCSCIVVLILLNSFSVFSYSSLCIFWKIILNSLLGNSWVSLLWSQLLGFTVFFWWFHISLIFSVQLFSCVQLFVTPWTAAHQASLSITNSWSLLKLVSIESVMPSSHLMLCRPLLLPPPIFPSIRVFSKESVLHIGFFMSPISLHRCLNFWRNNLPYFMDWLW